MAKDISEDLRFDMSKWQKYLGQDKNGEELKKAQLVAIELHFQCFGNGSDASNRTQSICRAKLESVRESVRGENLVKTKEDEMLSYVELMERALTTYKEFIDGQGFEEKEKELRYIHWEDLKCDIGHIRAPAGYMEDASPTVTEPRRSEDMRKRMESLRRRVGELKAGTTSLRAGPSSPDVSHSSVTSPPPDRSTSATSASQLEERGHRENAGSREYVWL